MCSMSAVIMLGTRRMQEELDQTRQAFSQAKLELASSKGAVTVDMHLETDLKSLLGWRN